MISNNLFIGLCLLHTAIANSVLCPYDGLIYPAPDDCHAFLKCVSGRPKKIPCSPPTYNYNCETHNCENITHCCSKTTTHTTEAITKQTPVTITSTSVKETSPNSQTCTKNGVKFPYKGDCKSYSQCNNGQLDKHKCRFGLSYNCITKLCSIFSFAPCCENNTSIGNGNICLLNGIKVPNPFTCNKYFECADHRIVQNTCPTGQRYHWFQEKCIDAAPGKCDADTSPNTVTLSDATTCGPTETHCEKEGTTIPAVCDCRSYYKCENGTFKKHTCQEGQVWNCFSQACGPKCFSPCCKDDPNPPNNSNSSDCLLPAIKIPNPFTCNKYFVCHNFNIIEEKCPAGKKYDWLWMKCVKAKTGKCAPTILGPTSPTGKPSGNPSNPTEAPTGNPSNPTRGPTGEPSGNPSNPTGGPTSEPSSNPSNPTGEPTLEPSGKLSNPTVEPSGNPNNPTGGPTGEPLSNPRNPTGGPTNEPSGNPGNPTGGPTVEPSGNPSNPTGEPTGEPSSNPRNPTRDPTSEPSGNPSYPTSGSTIEPSGNPSNPTGGPTGEPSSNPRNPTRDPTSEPSGNPSNPTSGSTVEPSGNSSNPTDGPTGEPSSNPRNPTEGPTREPSGNPSNPTGEPAGEPSSNASNPTGGPTSEPSGNLSNPTGGPTEEPSSNASIPTGGPTSEPSGNSSNPTGGPSGNPSNPTPAPTPFEPIPCRKGEKIADPDDSQSYFRCEENGQLIHEKCFANLYYECWLRICGPEFILARAPHCSKNTNSNTGEALSCTQLGNKIPDPYNCKTYYECDFYGSSLKTKYQTCPNSQSFDAISNSCKNQHEAVCIGDLSKHVTTVTVEPPVTQQPSIYCPQGGIKMPDSKDCTSYSECDSNRQLIHKTCPSGKVWNCISQSCTDEIFSPCCRDDAYNSKYNSSAFCPSNDRKLPNFFTCDKYYTCKEHVIEERTCSEGERYDWLLAKCVEATSENCVSLPGNNTPEPTATEPTVTDSKPTVTDSEPTVTDSKPTVTDSIPTPAPNTHAPITCQRGQQIADPDDNHSYYECDQNGHLIHTQCIFGLYYECWIRICGPIHVLARAPYCSKINNGNTSQPLSCTQLGSKIPDPYNCGTYYECDYLGMELKTKRLSCPNGQSFDAISNYCKNKDEAVCIGDLGKPVTTATVTPPVTNPPVTQPPQHNTTIPNTSKPPTKETTTSSSTITTKSKPKSPLCPVDDLLYPSSIPRDCGAYMKCIDGQPKRIECPAATPTYNCEKKACEYQKEPHCCASKG